MKIRTKYILFVVLIHLAALVLSYFVFKDQKWIFLLAEIFIIVSIYLCYQLYRQLLQPLKLMVEGTEAIAERDFTVKFVETGSYEMDKLITVYNAMIDELRDERVKQQEQHYFLEKLIRTSPTGIMILDLDGNVELVNPMAEQLLQLDAAELLKKQVSDIDHPVLRKMSNLASGSSILVSTGATSTFKVHKSHFVDRGFPRHFIMIEALTAEILRAEKNAYGKVIRMMAHEVNNTIGPVNSIMGIAESRFAGLHTDQQLREAVQVAIQRNNNLNQFMRNFADLVRIPLPARQQFDLVELVKRTGGFMAVRAQEKQIEFQYDLPLKEFIIEADALQLEQVLINIIKNAIEAIGTSGRLRFVIDPVKRGLSIFDNGRGVGDELSAQLFQPFFSTKKDGQGIGLTLIREVLYNHGYRFYLKTHAVGMTEFWIGF